MNENKSSEEYVFKTSQEASELVFKTCRKTELLLVDETKHLTGRERYLIWGRCINAFAASFYKTSIDSMETSLNSSISREVVIK